MYTRCPHCTTIFQITAERLRVARGDVPCVTCDQSFNALESLSDNVTALIPALSVTAAEPEDEERHDGTEASDDPQSAADLPGDPRTVDDDKSDDDETAQSERLDDADNEEDTRDQPLADLSDFDPEYAAFGNPALDERADDEDTDDILYEDDETEQEPAPDDIDDQEDTRDQPFADLSNLDSEPAALENPAFDEWADDDQSAESLEFNAPEQTWTKFFLADDENSSAVRRDRFSNHVVDREPWISNADPGTIDDQIGDQDEWQSLLLELGEDDPPNAAKDPKATEYEEQPGIDEPESSDDSYAEPDEQLDDEYDEEPEEFEPEVIPPWLVDGKWEDTAEQRQVTRPSILVLGACAVLALLLAGQWLHYNRDALAADPKYGDAVRGIYGYLGAPLYPDWSLDAFEVTGTEAITGRSKQEALDVLANVVVLGRQPTGLPLIRIVLRDRWSTPVASRVFEPAEYLRDFNPANQLVTPGTALPVEVSVADPGSEALGYIVDVCLPRRKTGLECQIVKDPFQ